MDSQEINVKSLFLVTRSFIKSQLDPKNPTGTIIFVSSGLSGLVTPGWSAYVTSKLAAERFIEHVDAGEFSSNMFLSREQIWV